MTAQIFSIVGITSIGLDHTKILGDTLEKIAWQKGGIFKPGCKALTVGDHKDSILQVLRSRAIERQCQLEVVPSLDEYCWDSSKLSFPQKLNASLALQLAKAWDVWNNNRKHINYAKYEVTPREHQSISECQIAGRCQILNLKDRCTTYYLDGAHTLESMRVAKDWFETTAERYSKKIFIFNVTGGRSVKPLLEVLQECQFDEAIFCSNNISNNANELPPDLFDAGVSIEEGLAKAKENLSAWTSIDRRKGTAVSSVSQALSLAQSSAGNNQCVSVLITGSMHLVGSALALLQPS